MFTSSGNNLHTLEPGPFQVMRFWEPRERHLVFNNCYIKHIHPSTFHFIPTFSGISLSRNHAIKQASFKNILDEIAVESLSFMDLSDMNIYDINHLSVTLKYSVKLQKLHLSNNKLKVIPKGIFFFLTKLRMLDLSQNMIRYIENLAGLVRLERLVLASNDLRSLSEEMFSGLHELKHLDVSFNDLRHIKSDVFSDLFSLQSIQAQGNSIEKVELEGGLENLQTFNLNFNKLSQLNFASSFPNLHFFSVSHNSLENLTQALLIRSHRLKDLDMSMNSIVALNKQFFQYLIAHKVDLSGNKLSKIEYYGWNHKNLIKSLNLQNNRAVEIKEDSFTNLNDLVELNLGKNRLTFLPLNVFRNLEKLKSLNLNENPLGKCLESQQPIMASLTNLRQLGIKQTDLGVLKKELLANNKKLFELDVSNNKLSKLFSPFVKSLPHLTILNASNNRLSSMQEDISTYFSFDRRQLDISGNPFRCDCSLLATCHYFDSSLGHRSTHSHYSSLHDIVLVSLAAHRHFCHEPRSRRGSNVEMECETIVSSCENVNNYVTIIILGIIVVTIFLILFILALSCCIIRRSKNKSSNKEKKPITEAYLENRKLLPVAGEVKAPQGQTANEKETVENVYKKCQNDEAPADPLIAIYCGLNFKGLKVNLDTSKSSNSTSSNSDQSMSNPLYSKKPFV